MSDKVDENERNNPVPDDLWGKRKTPTPDALELARAFIAWLETPLNDGDSGLGPPLPDDADSAPTMSVRAMIIEAMKTAPRPLRTHEIYQHTQQCFPSVEINKNTVAAAVNRLATQTPPILVARSEDARGPMYSLDGSALPSNRNGALAIQ